MGFSKPTNRMDTSFFVSLVNELNNTKHIWLVVPSMNKIANPPIDYFTAHGATWKKLSDPNHIRIEVWILYIHGNSYISQKLKIIDNKARVEI